MTEVNTVKRRIHYHREILSLLSEKEKDPAPVFSEYIELLKQEQDPIEQKLVLLYEWLNTLLMESARERQSPFGTRSGYPSDKFRDLIGERVAKVIEEGLNDDETWTNDLENLEAQAKLFDNTLWEHALALLLDRYKAARVLTKPPAIISLRPDMHKKIPEENPNEFNGLVTVREIAEKREAEHTVQLKQLDFSYQLSILPFSSTEPATEDSTGNEENINLEEVQCGEGYSLRIECEQYPLNPIKNGEPLFLELGESYPFLVRLVESNNSDAPQMTWIHKMEGRTVEITELLADKSVVDVCVTAHFLDATGPFTADLRIRITRS